MKKFLIFIVALLVVFEVAAFPLFAASDCEITGSISGSVMGHSNTPSEGSEGLSSLDEMVALPDIKVVLSGPVNIETVTDKMGKYYFSDIPVGKYKISTNSEFHTNSEIDNVMVDATYATSLNVYDQDLFLGSTFYFLSGINDFEKVLFGEYCMNYLYDAFSYYNVLAKNVDKLIGLNFDKEAFFEYFRKVGSKLQSEDTVIFYYYGTVYTSDIDGEIYLSCIDSKFVDGEPIFSTLISSSEISDLMNENFLNMPNVFFLLEGEYTKELAIKLLEKTEAPLGVLAASSGEVWFEISNVLNGLMSHGLIYSIDIDLSTQKARCDVNGDGFITIFELVSAIEEYVDIYAVYIGQEVSFHSNELFIKDAKFFKHIEYDFNGI